MTSSGEVSSKSLARFLASVLDDCETCRKVVEWRAVVVVGKVNPVVVGRSKAVIKNFMTALLQLYYYCMMIYVLPMLVDGLCGRRGNGWH